MAERDAYVVAKQPWLVFGDGQLAQINHVEMKVGKESKLVEYVFEFRPLESMMKFHEIPVASLHPMRHTLTKAYAFADIIPLSTDPVAGLYLCKTNYNGEKAVFALHDSGLGEMVKSLEKQVQAQNQRLKDLVNQLLTVGATVDMIPKR